MSDGADDAQILVEWRIKSSLSKLTKVIECGTGHCYFCLETIDVPQRFCDSDCRDDYERLRKLEWLKWGSRPWGIDAINLEIIDYTNKR
ncbi:DUF2116 family Zn-ribbon domain-containing protein [uncultured Shewanella sp.]|uniref:DUF2116 family Zn-ribbon domain-containing protein n=1 Tax=uncultured Shewanella sp. TaxID=173975 RepID=UPI002605F6C0|nr:DUF2116 family Zn-ribbon domain-containing protein [uncultured Shewanella sp.]